MNAKSLSLVTSESNTGNKLLPGANVWTDSRRGLSDSSKPIELLLVDKSATASAQIPPHPSTLKPSDLEKPMRKTRPRAREDKRNSVLLNRVVKPLEELGVVSDATIPGANVWQGWVRVPKKGESWESRKERIEGIQNMDGNFRLVNVTYVSSSKSALMI